MDKMLMNEIVSKYQFSEKQVKSVLELLEENNTVPFIARYRKEATGGLDEVQIKQISDEYQYVANLQKRKDEVIHNIEQQGLLTNELKEAILKQTKLQRVEDLYRPFKQKKKTRATEAKRKGLESLAQWISDGQQGELSKKAEAYISDEVATVDEAIQGALDIIAEHVSDNPKYRSRILKDIYRQGNIVTAKKKKADDEKETFAMYYDYVEPIKNVANHRVLAMNRGEKEKVLSVKVEFDTQQVASAIEKNEVKSNNPHGDYIKLAIEDSLKRLIMPSIEREIRADLTEKAEQHAIEVFSENLKHLLLQPPMKGKQILGVDPAFRTGCKLAVINPYGTFIDKSVIYPHPPKSKVEASEKEIVRMIKENNIELIAIGNGTASRETEQFVADVIKKYNLDIKFIIVNEAGASVYSASEIARSEFPNFQVEERSAVSIGRRVQDPLSELVKIDPKSIGVGQYQHDVNQKELESALTFVVETAVNQVGVDVNTASKSLLQYVSGLSSAIAQNIIDYREENGAIKHNKEISKVKRLGAKTFEQSIGFLRIVDGSEPLDNTSIHPESYDVTYELLTVLNFDINDLGTDKLKTELSNINTNQIAEQLNVGVPTLEDIIKSLMAPNRDPRDEFETPILKSDVLSIEDLKEGMKLSGTVRNVVDFGAFVDIGVKQDGLVHISKLSKKFVKNPMDVVSVGDIVEVWILDIDKNKGKVSLTMIDPHE
ncbi:RNA-binding transcriptional accessory protein [Staphylococcus haemolyticus]|uniref:RNA-binding transcriptional accessory protein n=2 Tax=Staphylococcus haemolyticus TaxID=1283 RepID=A0AB38PCH7_STAHA|nr:MULTISPECIES: Tex family protein [Staphylococcus]MCE4964536.1 RNA-binding transcriptional accessory protein [Staphylococcus haemolyticus]MCE4988424.1 RNA-binding transcriptional accessory protein [Staphylococcus haemolyticus]MCE4992863.1 RNA-binding transcriptional accessory protein [Staphylococcus haemolyticus]PTK39928.1 RNA-binding transcriptional accessory protein [Staphylococcus haemolyticus]PTK52780.1 RNA-binding transcriptional accessory protein [Staphylococcus haemolyticus]